MSVVMIARQLQDSPHAIVRFNQHIILSQLSPENQPIDGFPTDTNALVDVDETSGDDDDGTMNLPTKEGPISYNSTLLSRDFTLKLSVRANCAN